MIILLAFFPRTFIMLSGFKHFASANFDRWVARITFRIAFAKLFSSYPDICVVLKGLVIQLVLYISNKLLNI